MTAVDVSEFVEHALGDPPVHLYFELTYSSYLVLERTLLQSLPHEWQERFVELMREAEELTTWLPERHYQVNEVARSGGRFVRRTLPAYRHGPRSLEELRQQIERQIVLGTAATARPKPNANGLGVL